MSPDRAIAMPVALVTDGWERCRIAVPRRGPARRRGLIPRAAGRARLIRGAVVHSFGMQEAIGVVGIGRTGVVISCRRLEPYRVAILRGAVWVLELPDNETHPAVGSRLRVAVCT